MIKKETIHSKYIPFFIIICLIIIPSKCFKYFKAFTLLSNNIVLITDKGIIKYNPQTGISQTIVELTFVIDQETEQEFFSFAQSPEEDGGTVFCRIKNYIYVFDESDYIGSFCIEPNDIYCVLNPYKTSNGGFLLIVSFISDHKIKVITYTIDPNNNIGTQNGLAEKTIKTPNNEEASVSNNALSCEIFDSSNPNKILTCFVIIEEDSSLTTISFNLENSLELLYYSNNTKSTNGISFINSVIDTTKKKKYCLYN